MRLKNHPNTFIIGAPKCGTSALSNFMAQHDEVFFSPIKEPLYYGRHVSSQVGMDFSNYLKLFENANSSKYKIIAEATPCILYDIASIKEILSHCPDANFIVMIRSPIDAVISDFIQTKKSKNYDKSVNVDEAWEECLSRRRNGLKVRFKYDIHFLYYKHISNILNVICPKKLKIIFHEDLLDKPNDVLKDLFLFLNIDEGFSPAISIINQAGVIKRGFLYDASFFIWRVSKPLRHRLGIYNLNTIKKLFIDKSPLVIAQMKKISSTTRQSIIEHHLSDIHALEQLTNRDLSHWKQ